MSIFVTLLADVLVAVLLVATIATSIRLSRRIAQLKGDETALRQTIGDLMVATSNAERAIVGLRGALAECDRTLAERLGTAERYAADIAAQVEAGQGVIARIGAIVAEFRPGAQARPEAQSQAQSPVRGRPEPLSPPAVAVPAAAPVLPESPNGERLGAAAAAALAMSERALSRVRSRAA
ncbi:DUF6468 domain-containing protein [Methylobacterium oxalidis]|uniref:DUF6468 domain-containing protein n=1 Tax=Methylobacterium oxalidis TaxID=944322 RepID=A0A512J0F8_9HYPH|nr:DUF6468 domain-containing protein [Methylobacterium oxalidis]GEP03446.1 hypothetical protein MOX02_14840 [Methylobacterium oxalidis]GJE30242.1 hypothetical protein LDDCCGHA_0407 [Methylobacterium oxalidis]GLS63349.1 hypothetical protein GCM10007888_17300 [Methylobacterium oxalidis]